MKKNKKERSIVFIFFAAACFPVIVVAFLFYWLGVNAETAFRISVLWLALSIPFGYIVGAYLHWRDNSNSPVYRIVHYGEKK